MEVISRLPMTWTWCFEILHSSTFSSVHIPNCAVKGVFIPKCAVEDVTCALEREIFVLPSPAETMRWWPTLPDMDTRVY